MSKIYNFSGDITSTLFLTEQFNMDQLTIKIELIESKKSE